MIVIALNFNVKFNFKSTRFPLFPSFLFLTMLNRMMLLERFHAIRFQYEILTLVPIKINKFGHFAKETSH